MSGEMDGDGSKTPRRLSQIFDPLSRLSELTRVSHSTPSSPRLLPRRSRDGAGVPSLAAFDVLDAGEGQACGGNGVNWQERCLELQLELHRSRAQATRTRDMLREKVRVAEMFFTMLKVRFHQSNINNNLDKRPDNRHCLSNKQFLQFFELIIDRFAHNSY